MINLTLDKSAQSLLREREREKSPLFKSEGHGDKGCDVRLMMVAAFLMFTIVSLRKQEAGLEKAREPGPPACKQRKTRGSDRE